LATYTIGKGVVIMDTLSKYWTYQRNDSSSFRPSCDCSMKLLDNQVQFAFNYSPPEGVTEVIPVQAQSQTLPTLQVSG